jgi:hypothetical protein
MDRAAFFRDRRWLTVKRGAEHIQHPAKNSLADRHQNRAARGAHSRAEAQPLHGRQRDAAGSTSFDKGHDLHGNVVCIKQIVYVRTLCRARKQDIYNTAVHRHDTAVGLCVRCICHGLNRRRFLVDRALTPVDEDGMFESA